MKTDFRTTFSIPEHQNKLNRDNSFTLIGSCFSENIGKKLSSLKFDSISNPLGISYNPISIHQLLQLETPLSVEHRDDVFFSYQLHSELNQLNEEAFHASVQRQFQLQNQQLAKQGTLIITYGTAWVYELKEGETIVNNCQKTPSNQFNKRMLSVEEIVSSWERAQSFLQREFPELNIVFTLSPVRHLKDGVRENQLSKSVLTIAIEQISAQHENCSYFPSYEIMMDDLRDYRFYEADLIHPNQIAIDYIWKSFELCYFSENTRLINQELSKITASLQHKAFQAQSEKHQHFLKQLLQKTVQFQAQKGIDFQSEIEDLQAQIK